MSLKDLAGAVSAALPERLGEDVRKNVRAVVRSTFEDMELVTREELEVQQQVLRRTREKLERLEKRVEALEAEMKGASTGR